MSGDRTWALPGRERTAPVSLIPSRLLTLASRDSDLLLVLGLGAVAIGLLELMSRFIGPDTWLALVAGRDVAQAGIPHHEVATVFAHGRAWVDEQWLSQLVMYGLYRLGGLPLLGAVNVGLIVSAVGGAVLAARRLGARARTIMRVMPLAVACVLPASELRTETYALPLFVATVYLLARDSRRPGRSVYWCLPLLVLWGNLHGSASMGAGLVGLRGLTILWAQRHELLRARGWVKPVSLLAGAPLALLATPYGASIITYYNATLLNGSLRSYVTEWQPITAVPLIAAAFFLQVGFAIWSFGRHAQQTTLWERCALLALAGLAVMSVRNVPWFGLAVIAVLPLSIEAAVGARARKAKSRPALNLTLVGGVVVGLVVALTTLFARGASVFERHYPAGALAAVQNQIARDRSLRVFADERFADWLLWRLPALNGRVAYDARFELLSARQVRSVIDVKFISGLDWKRAVSGYRLLVLDPITTSDAVKAFERERGARVLYEGQGMVVILRGSAQSPA
jgi:hypothetical protein